MKQLFLGIAGVVAVAAVSAPADAHHSGAPFDFTRPTTIQGTVKEFGVRNPHTHAVITVSDAKGTRDVAFEGHSASNFYRAGFKRGSIKHGDKVTITYAPRRDGEDGGFILAFTGPDGKRIGFGPA